MKPHFDLEAVACEADGGGSMIATCTHRVPHEHGTTKGYRCCGCRCQACMDAHTRDLRHANHERRNGHARSVDAAPVAKHLERLLAGGWNKHDIAAATGVHIDTIVKLGQRKRIYPSTAAAILALKPRCTSIGTSRRLQALSAQGWSMSTIATRYGLHQSWLSYVARNPHGREFKPDTMQTIAAIFDELWDRQPPGDGSSTYARTVARKNGWVPALAWDSIDYDRRPVDGWQRPKQPQRGADVIELLDRGEARDIIAERLGVTRTTVDRIAARRAA